MNKIKYPKYIKGNGKILLSGEYVILNGGWGLAFPSKIKHQKIYINKIKKKYIFWESINNKNKIWFQAIFILPTLKIIKHNNFIIAKKLKKLLTCIKSYKDTIFNQNHGFYIKTILNFPITWGLGSSSSLIYGLSKWLNINPFNLLWKYNNNKGSGYDIACNLSDDPLLYKIENKHPKIITLKNFYLPFIDKLYLAYTNKKQQTNKEIIRYNKNKTINLNIINNISLITLNIIKCIKLKIFEKLISKHENIISKIINKPTIKNIYFEDYKGIVKSLGAWGGDLILITKRKGMKSYFKNKGFQHIYPFKNIIS